VELNEGECDWVSEWVSRGKGCVGSEKYLREVILQGFESFQVYGVASQIHEFPG
jgi:hypothetical protein